jgi:hypothetical protein
MASSREVLLGWSPLRLPLPACGERVGVRGRCRGRCGKDCVPHPFDILQDFIVPETKDAVAVLYEPSIAQGVAVAFSVLAAIDLDHESFLSTNKIDNIWPDRFLPHEFESSQRSGTKVSPKLLFGWRRVFPQAPRQCGLLFVCAAHALRPPHPNPLPACGERELIRAAPTA